MIVAMHGFATGALVVGTVWLCAASGQPMSAIVAAGAGVFVLGHLHFRLMFP